MDYQHKPQKKELVVKPDTSLLGTIAPVSALLLSVSILLMGNGLQGVLIPVRGSLESFPTIEIGLLGTAYFSGFTLGCIIGPSLIKRAGHIRAYLAMVSVSSVVALIHFLVVEPVVWMGLRAATGFAFAVLYIVIESWLNEKSTNKTRGTVFSIYTMINLTVITVGQMMLALADPNTFFLFALCSILVSLAALPVAFTTSVSPAAVPLVRLKLFKLYQVSPVGVIGCAAVGLVNGSFWALGPVFAQQQGFDMYGIGLFMSAVVLGGAFSQWPFGFLSDRLDRRYVMLLVTVIAVVSAIAILAFSHNQQTAIILAACFGAGAFPLYTLSIAHANDHAKPSDCVEVSSGLLFIYGMGAAIGPLILSALSQNLEGVILFLFTATVHILLMLAIIWRLKSTDRPEAEDRIIFSDSTIAAQTVSSIDPILKTDPADSRDSVAD